MRDDNKGIALIALILIMIIVAIISTAITSAVVSALRFSTFYSQKQQALAAAEAGMYAAIARYQQNGYWDKAATTIAGGASYKVGTAANFLLVNATNALYQLDTISNFPIKNISSLTEIYLNKIKIEWDASAENPANIVRFYINNTLVAYSDPAAPIPSGSTIDISAGSYTIPVNTTLNNNSINFISGISPSSYKILTFYFTDNSSRRLVLYDPTNPMNQKNEFSIISTGTAGNYKRTIEATYAVGAGNNVITSCKEVAAHL